MTRDANRNGMHVLSALGAAVVGGFLLLGAYGHLEAVLPLAESMANASRFALLLPGTVLALAGALNVVFCWFLWQGRPWAVHAALICTGSALAYLVYLLAKGVPDHPVGLFTGIVASYFVLLGATRLGLVWPAGDA